MIRNNIVLSKRLLMSAGMVTKGNRLADVGCDHAHTCIYLVKEGIVPNAIAMDVRKGPLSHADANIRLYGFEDRIETRLSDGLEALLPGEADTVIIAGMGGTLTVMILEKGIEKAAAAKELILQPQSDIGMVRRFLRDNGFKIVQEEMCIEDGKFYNSMKVVTSASFSLPSEVREEPSDMSEVYDEFGEFLLKNNNEVLREYLKVMEKKTERVLERILNEGSEGSLEKREFFEHYKILVEKAKGFYSI